MKLTPRPYQFEAIAALDAYLASSNGNPLVVLPTGAGKTPTYAWAIQRYLNAWPSTRVVVLAHIRELLEQGVEKMRAIWPMAPVGIFSAGLKANDRHYPITFASIQSVFKHACKFDPFDLIFIDEAHRVPLEQEGQYRRFIAEAKLCNPHVRTVGWTATPYRLSGGTICHKDYIFNDIVYEANVKELIDQGYLSPLRTKLGAAEVDTSRIRHSRGEFDARAASQAFTDDKVAGIVDETLSIMDREGRRAAIFFCCTVEHAEQMSAALAARGVEAPTIHANTPSDLRARNAQRFVRGDLRALCNVNVLSEGFDAQRIDCVVLVRPTESKGLYYQQVGRGLRIHADKKDCLVLDFAGNVARHGPIDLLAGTKPELATCGGCRECFPRAIGRCPECGKELPPPEPGAGPPPGPRERIIPTDPKGRIEAPVLSDSKPWEMTVQRVDAELHPGREGKPASVKVTYYGPLESHREWVCLSHDGYAKAKAQSWWKTRFPGEPIPVSSEEALAQHLFLGQEIADRTESITVRSAGRFTEVIGAKFKRQHVGALVR